MLVRDAAAPPFALTPWRAGFRFVRSSQLSCLFRAPHGPPFLARGYLLFVSVQVEAVNAKAEETPTRYSKFTRKVGRNWDLVKGRLVVTLGDWREDTFEEQWGYLSNNSEHPMTPGQATELAREINKLLCISEWRVQDRSSASPTPAQSLARLSVPGHPQPG